MSIKEHHSNETTFTDLLAENTQWANDLFRSCGIVINKEVKSIRQHTIAPGRRLDNAWYADEKCIVIAETQCGKVDYDHMQKSIDYASFAKCNEAILICESITEDAIKVFSGYPKSHLHLYLVTVNFCENGSPLWQLRATNNPVGNLPTKWVEPTEIYNYGTEDGRIISSLSDGISLLELLKNLSGLGIPEEFSEATRQRVFACHISDLRRGEIQTPRPLVEEMLNKIPEEFFKATHTTFLDPACGTGTFLVAIKERLLQYGHTEKNILKRLYGIDKVVDNTILTALKLGSATNIFADDTLLTEEVRHMKFDVIIGNPPYQDPNHDAGHSLWEKFTLTMIKQKVSDGGIVSFVTPSSWCSPTSDVFKTFKENDFYVANTDIAHYFPGVGSTFSSWAIRKQPYNNLTSIDGTNFNIMKFAYLPHINGTLLNSCGVNIHYKTVMNGELEKFDFTIDTINHGSNPDKSSNEKSEKFKYPLCHTSAKYKNGVYKYGSTEQKNYTRKKVICSLSGYFEPTYFENPMGTTQHSGYILVSSETQGKHLVSILNSKLFKFLLLTSKTSGFNHQRVAENLPSLNLSKDWSDEEIFEHFNITKKEVEYINKILGE